MSARWATCRTALPSGGCSVTFPQCPCSALYPTVPAQHPRGSGALAPDACQIHPAPCPHAPAQVRHPLGHVIMIKAGSCLAYLSFSVCNCTSFGLFGSLSLCFFALLVHCTPSSASVRVGVPLPHPRCISAPCFHGDPESKLARCECREPPGMCWGRYGVLGPERAVLTSGMEVCEEK